MDGHSNYQCKFWSSNKILQSQDLNVSSFLITKSITLICSGVPIFHAAHLRPQASQWPSCGNGGSDVATGMSQLSISEFALFITYPFKCLNAQILYCSAAQAAPGGDNFSLTAPYQSQFKFQNKFSSNPDLLDDSSSKFKKSSSNFWSSVQFSRRLQAFLIRSNLVQNFKWISNDPDFLSNSFSSEF